MIFALVAGVIGVILFSVGAFTTETSSGSPRQVWSPEHGHYHAVP
jgi:hypothetical protein